MVLGLAKGNTLLHRKLHWDYFDLFTLCRLYLAFLSLVFKHQQVVCPCGAHPQVILFLWAQTQCFLCAQVCQIFLQGWDWENATLSLFTLMCQVRSHPYRRVFVWLCQYYSLTPLLQMAFQWHSLRAAIEDYRPVSNSVACRVECDPQKVWANILRTVWLHLLYAKNVAYYALIATLSHILALQNFCWACNRGGVHI